MRAAARAVAVAALGCLAACGGGTDARPSPPSATAPPERPTATLTLDCSDPIDAPPSPRAPLRGVLDAVALDTASTLQATGTGGTSPHRLFAKTALLVRAGRPSEVRVPEDWAERASISWGNHAPRWTRALRVPACPAGSGRWLLFPGGLSLDEPGCVPLEVRAGDAKAVVHVSAGARCPE